MNTIFKLNQSISALSFWLLAFSFLSSCSIFTTKTPEVQVQNAPTANEQMYPGHAVMASAEVPPPVLASWNKDHSGVKAEWYKTDQGYMVFYATKKKQSKFLFDENGKELLHSREVKGEDVPGKIREYMKVKYPGTQYGRTFISYLPDGSKTYDVYVTGDQWEMFDMDGNSIEKKKQ